jgi:hypothetical protein
MTPARVCEGVYSGSAVSLEYRTVTKGETRLKWA